MRIFTLSLLFLFSSLAGSAQDYIDQEFVLEFKTAPNERQAAFQEKSLQKLHQQLNVQAYKTIGNLHQKKTYKISYKQANISVLQAVELYQQTQLFRYVEPNYILETQTEGEGYLPNDPLLDRQWYLHNEGQYELTEDIDIDANLAWEITTGSPHINIAILDTGLKLDHPEFAGRLWINNGEKDNGFDNDNNGFIGDINGWDFYNNDALPFDDNGHGTAVSGVLGANGDDGSGYAGLDWNARLMTIKIANENGQSTSAILASAIYYAVHEGAHVINISFGGTVSTKVLEDAIIHAKKANISVVAATGNSNNSIQFPARYSSVIAVGASDPDDERSHPFVNSTMLSGSCFGEELDLIAPGNQIFILSHADEEFYNQYGGGTSLAAPLVTGTISLLLSIDSTLKVSEIRTILNKSCDEGLGAAEEEEEGWDKYHGHGRLNTFNCLLNVLPNKATNNPNFSIYPTPIESNGLLTLEGIQQHLLHLELYNSMGQHIKSYPASSVYKKTCIQLPELATGVYLLYAHGEGWSSSRKVVVH